MKQLITIAAVVLVGCSKDTPETSQAAEAEAQVAFVTEPVLPANEKLIAPPSPPFLKKEEAPQVEREGPAATFGGGELLRSA